MIQLFLGSGFRKLAKKEGRNANGHFANRWKRRISLAARRAMIYQAHYALRKYFREDHPDYDELSDDDQEIQLNYIARNGFISGCAQNPVEFTSHMDGFILPT